MAEQHTIEQYYNFDYIDLGYTNEDLLKEWDCIKRTDHDYDSTNMRNKLIKQFQFEEFYKKEIAMWKENPEYKGLPLRSWLYMNRNKYIGKGYGELTQEEIMRGFRISGIHIGNSFHSPYYIKKFIKDYGITSIYDCCGGWGHRMLGAAAANAFYIYNDINHITTQNCRALADYLNLNVQCCYSEDSASFTPKEYYEAVFTCPPYHCTEIYSKRGSENLPYQQFLTWWYETILHSCIKKDSCKYFAYIINHVYDKDLLDVCKNAGLNLLEEHFVGTTKAKSHFINKHDCIKYEKVLIFTK